MTRDDGCYWLPQPHCLHPHWIKGLQVTEVQCQLPHQCHQGLIDLDVPGMQTMADDTRGSPEAI